MFLIHFTLFMLYIYSSYSIIFYLFFFFLMIRRPPSSPLFPYPPLFRSRRLRRQDHSQAARHAQRELGAVPPHRAARSAPLPEPHPPRHRRRYRPRPPVPPAAERQCGARSEEHTSELQSLAYLVCRLLLE